jgi:cytochrome c oxidase cbb3-type subunit II
MKGLIPLFIGLFGTFTFSWVGLTVIPNVQIGALNPQSDEEGTDIYPVPKSGMAQRGRSVYTANGCFYCHTQQLRPDYAAADLERVRDAGVSPRPKWGERRSAPRDYVFEAPVVLGEERMGPDLANIGKAAPGQEQEPAAAPGASSPAASPAAQQSPAPNAAPQKSPSGGASPPAAASVSPSPSDTPNPNGIPPAYSEAWHHRHLYSPRSMSRDNLDSTMPAYRFLYEKRRISGERSADALQLTGADAPPAGWEVVPTYEAKCLVAYLMAQDQSHPLKEAKGATGAPAPAAASPAASAAAPAGSPAAQQPPKK